MAQLVRAPRSHRGDRWFESSCAHISTSASEVNLRSQNIQMESFFRNHLEIGFKMVKIISLSTYIVLLLVSGAIKSTAETCIDLTSPTSGTIISSTLCTLKVENKCKDISKVEFQARYYLTNSDSAVVKTLAQLNKTPYEYVWNISKISNQLFSGVSLLATAFHKNGQIEEVGKDGIFFTHNKMVSQSFICAYDYSGIKNLKTLNKIQLEPNGNAFSMSASAYWNEKDITFLVEVKDPSFFGGISKEVLAETGVEILIDTSSNRRPYPSEDVLMYTVPLYGRPFQTIYKPEFSEDRFKLNSSSAVVKSSFSILKEDFKGFSIYFPIPRSQLGSSLPKNVAFNILIKTADAKNNIIRTSLVKGSLNEIYSPFLWKTLEFSPKPLMKNRILIWVLSFFTGLILAFFFKLMSGFITKKQHKAAKKESSEDEKNQFETIKSEIENKITVKGLTAQEIAQELRSSEKKINLLIKEFTGMSFVNYLMFARTEIAKERLRSSHSSEVSIAELCGFRDANEMEKYFRKFHKITPTKFRMEQQVA
jgi:AraC-like DNA-binding protein